MSTREQVKEILIELAFRAMIGNSDNWQSSFERHKTYLSEEGGSPLFQRASRMADEAAQKIDKIIIG